MLACQRGKRLPGQHLAFHRWGAWRAGDRPDLLKVTLGVQDPQAPQRGASKAGPGSLSGTRRPVQAQWP